MRTTMVVLFFIATMVGETSAETAADALESLSVRQQLIVDRNTTLRSLQKTAPETVRKIVLAIEAMEQSPDSRSIDIQEDADSRVEPIQLPPSADPDLDRLERSAPEAVNDLFQLIKQAGSQKATLKP